MTSMLKHLSGCSLAAIALVAANPAFAAGTIAGSTINNTATVDFRVGGFDQVQQQDSDTFTVDRRVSLTVAEVGSTTTTVNPGQTVAVTAFTVTNTTNAPLDFALTAAQLVGGTASHGGTDVFNVTGLTIYRDEGNGTYDGTETAVTYLDEIAADGVARLFLVGAVPNTVSNGQVAGVTLTATAREAGGAAVMGALVTQTAGANTAGVDTVFGDTAGITGDAARDGSHSDDDDYTVAGALLTVDKSSRVVSDPFNGTTNPKLIPNAVVEYCIAVSNGVGGALATNVTVRDNVPSTLTFIPGTIRINGASCAVPGPTGGTYAAPQVSGTLNDIAAGSTLTLVFQATVN